MAYETEKRLRLLVLKPVTAVAAAAGLLILPLGMATSFAWMWLVHGPEASRQELAQIKSVLRFLGRVVLMREDLS